MLFVSYPFFPSWFKKTIHYIICTIPLLLIILQKNTRPFRHVWKKNRLLGDITTYYLYHTPSSHCVWKKPSTIRFVSYPFFPSCYKKTVHWRIGICVIWIIPVLPIMFEKRPLRDRDTYSLNLNQWTATDSQWLFTDSSSYKSFTENQWNATDESVT